MNPEEICNEQEHRDSLTFLLDASRSRPRMTESRTALDLRSMGIDQDSQQSQQVSSRRQSSTILATLRRPSQLLALSNLIGQRRQLGLTQTQDNRSNAEICENGKCMSREKKRSKQMSDDALSSVLSALYAKLLVVMGIAFPITEVVSHLDDSYYQPFYLFLYLISIIFIGFTYSTLIKERTVIHTHRYQEPGGTENSIRRNGSVLRITGVSSTIGEETGVVRYGSFYLRLGAIAFGIGSMVYSGLEFGRYFELRNSAYCNSDVLQAITPATRMLLTLLQVQFIFLNSRDLELSKHKTISKFGLMHMIATNLCEWLHVLVEETKHEIVHMPGNVTHNTTENLCHESNVMSSLVTNASAFLFPCKIEYSLICAVILYEMWKKLTLLNKRKKTCDHQNKPQISGRRSENVLNTGHHFSIDCSNSHRGLFGGILIIVLTIISLIMFFVFISENENNTENNYKKMAEFEVNIVELILYLTTTICVIFTMLRMRKLKYDRKIGEHGPSGLCLDRTLLVVAQTGTFIYCIFSIIACYFTLPQTSMFSLLADVFFLLQTFLQTIFVLDGWWRRCRNVEQAKSKPGRELITFLIIANMAMWTINSLMKNRAEFRSFHLLFFGNWTWTIITHISMPLAIFYRFHSTICLFEIWKNAYKLKRSSEIA